MVFVDASSTNFHAGSQDIIRQCREVKLGTRVETGPALGFFERLHAVRSHHLAAFSVSHEEVVAGGIVDVLVPSRERRLLEAFFHFQIEDFKT